MHNVDTNGTSIVWRMFLGLLVSFLMLGPVLMYAPTADARKLALEGMSSVSYRNMVVGEKATFIAYDPDGLTDDYAYMASVPASVFYSDGSDKVVANPLLFWDDPNADLGLNANQGINYFMDDVSTISTDGLDTIETVNLDSAQVNTVTSSWPAGNTHSISGTDPARLASQIAEFNWEYSDNAVVAVVDTKMPFEEVVTQGEFTGETPADSVITGSFQGTQDPSPVDPNIHDFDIPEGYRYINSKMTWGQGPAKEITQRGKDPDLQIYDNQLGEVASSADWNVESGASEEIGSYVYNEGSWSFAVTYMPTESLPPYELDDQGHALSYGMDEPIYYGYDADEGKYITDDPNASPAIPDGSSLAGTLQSGDTDRPAFMSTVRYTIDYTLYPGVVIPLPEGTPYACRDASFDLTWDDSSQSLGLILLGPSSAEIKTAISSASSQSIEIDQLGQGNYSVAVVNLGDNAAPTGFSVNYQWRQVRPEMEAHIMSNAANGAVLASTLNAPLLYATRSRVPDSTKRTLDLLGVRNVCLVDINGEGGKDVQEELEGYRSFLEPDLSVSRITCYKDLYSRIIENTRGTDRTNMDVVFTTLDGYSVEEAGNDHGPSEGGNPVAEQLGGRFVGPGAYEAAIHGTPCIIVEAHPELSCAQAWHNAFWQWAYPSRLPPSVGCMILTGKYIYSFLEDFDIAALDDDPETIITVAGQFNIGAAWDRSFVGAANSGRIQGTPADTAYWVSRGAFYHDLIFANPAVNPELDEQDGNRIQGSHSTRVGGILTVTDQEKEEAVANPITMTWVSYQHRFNERGSKYWGCSYTSREGVTPYETASDNPIDPDGKWPDIHTSKMVPYYTEKCGYGSVYTTALDPTMENLNRGSVLWLEVMHGGNHNSGIVGFWDTQHKESDPWRGYEEIIHNKGAAYGAYGATDDPDVASMNRQIGIDAGTVGVSGPGGLVETHDGVVIAIVQQWQTTYVDGYMLNDRMENLHSLGFSGGSCLIANSFMHMTMIRHGMSFTVIDPWLTSWYSTFAMECFMRELALNPDITAGEAYTAGISHVGILYLMDGWWWDLYENLVFYGDPDMKVWTPQYAWNISTHMAAGTSVDGHNIYGATEHPNEIQANFLIVGLLVAASLGAIGAGAAVFIFIKKKDIKLPGQK